MKCWRRKFITLPITKVISITYSKITGFIDENRFPIIAALGLRVATSVWLAVIWVFIDPYFLNTDRAVNETYNHLKIHESLVGRALLDVWLRWDAVHYMNLAWGGYDNAGAADMNFWPLYPYLVRFIQPVLMNETVLTGLVVSTIATVIAAVYFWKLVLYLYQDRVLANLTVLVWAIYPTSFFLVAPFTEALFAALAVTAIWNITQRKWIAAGILAAFAGLTRSQGILLIVPYLLIFGYDWFFNARRKTAHALIGLACLPLGTLGFMLWRTARGVPDFVSSYATYSQAQILDPFSSIFLAIKRLIAVPDLLSITELLSVLVFLSILVYMFTQPIFRKHPFFIIYGIVTVLFILIKHNMGASPLQSSNRYVLNALPAFVGIGYLLKLSSSRTRFVFYTLSSSLALITAVLYAMWIFVG